MHIHTYIGRHPAPLAGQVPEGRMEREDRGGGPGRLLPGLGHVLEAALPAHGAQHDMYIYIYIIYIYI